VGGVALYRIAAADLSRYAGLAAAAMARRNEQTRFNALMAAARSYLIGGPSARGAQPDGCAKAGAAAPRIGR
jgi:hypothetical protein